MKKPEEQTETSSEIITPEGDIDDLSDLRKIQEILRASDVSGGFIRLERKGPTDQVFQYICKIPIEDWDIEHIKRVYGGGDYKARTFRADGKFFKPFEFAIDYRVKGSLDESQMRQVAAQPDNSRLVLELAEKFKAQEEDRAQMRVWELMSEKNDKFMMMFMTALTKSQETQIAMLTQAFQAMNSRPQADFSAAVTPVLVEMVRSKNSNGIGELVGALKELRSLDEEKGSVWDKLLEVAPAALGLLAGRPPALLTAPRPAAGQNGNPAAEPAPGAAPAPPAALAPPAAPAAPAGEICQNTAQMHEILKKIVSAGLKDSDPAAYCIVINDWLKEEELERLKTLLRTDIWWQVLFGAIPQSENARSWIEELRDYLLNGLPADEDAPGGASGGASGTTEEL